jgi:hypothetical protein
MKTLKVFLFPPLLLMPGASSYAQQTKRQSIPVSGDPGAGQDCCKNGKGEEHSK